MCTGIEIAGLAASLAGTGAGIASSQLEKGAMEDKAKQEFARQQEYQNQAKQVFARSLSESKAPVAQQQIKIGQDKQASLYKSLQAVPLGGSVAALPQDSQSVGRDQATMALSNASRAANTGYNELPLQQWLSNQNANQKLGAIGSIAGQSAGVLPYELQSAQNSWSGLAGAGSLLGSLGSLASIYGAMQPNTTQMLKNRVLAAPRAQTYPINNFS